jgi:hypothetical protein
LDPADHVSVGSCQYFNEQKPAWAPTKAMSNFKAIPKMVINAGNDEFFLPTDNHFW